MIAKRHACSVAAAIATAMIGTPQHALAAQPTWPSAYVVWQDGFEGPGLSEIWEDYGFGRIYVEPAAARPPSASGLSVDVGGIDQAYLQRFNLTDWPHLEFPRDTYFSFSLDPSGVAIPDGATVSLVRMRDGDWNLMAGIELRQVATGGYEIVLELPDGSTDDVGVALPDGWSTVVLGCRPHDWVGAWVEGEGGAGGERVVAGMSHAADFVQVILLGKPDGNWSGGTPSGTMHLDDVTLLFAAYPDIWVDAEAGSDAAEGDDPAAPIASLGLAAMLTSPGTVVHVAPGDYRESLVLPVDGEEGNPIRFVATGGRGTAKILGSEPASSLSWSVLADPAEIGLAPGSDVSGIWKADVSALGLDGPPRFVVIRAADGTIERLPYAREPDWQVVTPWKHHEFWWSAEGGEEVTTCDPVAEPDCDFGDRSGEWLIDHGDDADPAGVEPGSLESLGDVTGALVHVKDCWSGHYTYWRRVAECPEPGRVRLEAMPGEWTEGCWFDHLPSNPALGWNSKYFVEGLPRFMDTPGEWATDAAGGTIYVLTPDGRSPAEVGIEISVRDAGVDLSGRSWVEIVDLGFQLFEEEGVRISNGGDSRSYGILLAGLDVGWSLRGLYFGDDPGPGSTEGSQIRTLVLRDSTVHDTDSLAIATWAGSAEDFVRPGITNFVIHGNEFVRIGFRDDEEGGVGMSFHMADHLLFEANHVHHVAHNGVHFSQAKTTLDRGYDLAPEDILTGDILVRGNLFEDCVENAADAGGLKFWGATADRTHVFRDTLVVGNVSRNNVGWAWVSEKRDNWTYHGKGGMGYYVDYAGGVDFYRNIAYGNGLAGFMASGSWYDQPMAFANNTIADSPLACTMGVRGAFADAATGLDVLNNVFLDLDRFAISVGDERILAGEVSVDSDLFHLVGTEEWEWHTPGILAGHVDSSSYSEVPTLGEVQALGLEASGVMGDPMLAGYDPAAPDGSWQDFRLTEDSALAVDTGAPLPGRLAALLSKFGMTDGAKGAALDRGAIELDPSDPGAPFVIEVGPTDGSGEIVVPWETDYPDPPDPGGDGASGCGCSIVS